MDDSERNAIDKRIAIRLGWLDVHLEDSGMPPPGLYGVAPNSAQYARIPDYCGDLNATLPRLTTIDKGFGRVELLGAPDDYTVTLWQLFDDLSRIGVGYSEAAHATASTLAEAAARCLLAWLEEEAKP